MNPVKKTIGYTALVVGTLGGAWGTKQAADYTAHKVCEAVTAVGTEVQKTVTDAVGQQLVEGYRRVVTGIAKEAYEKKLEDMLIPPEIRKSLENIDQAVEQSEEEKQNAQIEDLQRIFPKGEKEKDPFRMDSLDLDRSRNIKKKR